MELSKILLPVDFSVRSEEAAHYTKALACRFDSEVILMHSFELREVIADIPPGGVPPNWYEDFHQATRRALEEFQADEFRNMPIRRILLKGDAASDIVGLAHAERVDLIVMPTHGYGRFRRFILGSVTAKVLHDADCAVLTGVHIEQPAQLEPVLFRNIVCAVDFDSAGERALRWAADFADAYQARLTLVHALPNIQVSEVSYYDPPLEVVLRDVAQQKLDDLQAVVGTAAEIMVQPGAVAQVVAGVAESRSGDLIVIGRHANPGLLGRLRSNAYGIVRESPCPVVSV